MEEAEEATTCFQKGLTIIQDFPKELKTKNLLLSSLGNIYFDAGYYDKSMEIYETMYECCTTELKKNKKYYVRICTYKKVGKTTYYSTWSKVKSVKVK